MFRIPFCSIQYPIPLFCIEGSPAAAGKPAVGPELPGWIQIDFSKHLFYNMYKRLSRNLADCAARAGQRAIGRRQKLLWGAKPSRVCTDMSSRPRPDPLHIDPAPRRCPRATGAEGGARFPASQCPFLCKNPFPYPSAPIRPARACGAFSFASRYFSSATVTPASPSPYTPRR